MSKVNFSFCALDEIHNRTSFNSSSAPLDIYFRQQVELDIQRSLTACFIALTGEHVIAGYYTLSATSIPLLGLPADVAKKMPRSPSVPAVRMGRLAVDQEFKEQGLGGALLADALIRSFVSDIEACAMLVDAQDDKAAAFYRYHSFIPLPDSPSLLFLPLATATSI